MTDVWGTIIAATALGVTVLTGFMKFLWNRIDQVDASHSAHITQLENTQREVTEGIRHELQRICDEFRAAMSAQSGELRQAMQTQASDHRLVQTNLWEELRRHSDRANEYNSRLIEAISKLATREEMNKSVELAEGRLISIMKKEVSER